MVMIETKDGFNPLVLAIDAAEGKRLNRVIHNFGDWLQVEFDSLFDDKDRDFSDLVKSDEALIKREQMLIIMRKFNDMVNDTV